MSTTQKVLVFGVIGALAVFMVVAIGSSLTGERSKVYSEDEFRRLVIGKTVAEVKEVLGYPQVEDYERGGAHSGKLVCGYIYENTSPRWAIYGRDGAACIYFAQDGRADHIQYVPKPQSGRFVLIRY